MSRANRIVMGAILVGWIACWSGAARASLRMEPSNVMLSFDVVATGLNSPAGLAAHPRNGQIYVAEQGGNRVSLIREKRVEGVIQSGFEIDNQLPDWAVGMGRDEAFWTEATLRGPVGLGFDSAGKLFVAESGVGGRVLEFSFVEGRLGAGRVVSTPWLHGDYSYSGLTLDGRDRLYLTARQSRSDTALPTGSAMVREPGGQWWMIDFGPFSDFAQPAVSLDSSFLILADRRSTDVVWYDRIDQVGINAMGDLSGIRHVTVLSDGTTIAAIEKNDATWSIVELDPEADVLREWLGNLSSIGGLYADPHSGDLYISLAEEGKVARVRLLEGGDPGPNKLVVMRSRYRTERDLPPLVWPEFFKAFIDQLGVVETINDPKEATNSRRKSVTLGEFAEAIPVVAGKAVATLHPDQPDVDDPIEEISFVLFLPNQSMFTDGTLTPSISLFCARHRSGHTSVTRFLPGQLDTGLKPDLDWKDAPLALVSFPSGFQAVDTPLADEGLLRVYFLGLGLGPDYYIDLHRRDRNRGQLIVETRSGEKIRYHLETLEESIEAGGQTLLVADNRLQTPGWQPVDDFPVVWTIVVDGTSSMNLRHAIPAQELFAHEIRVGKSLADSFERKASRKDLEWRRHLILRSATRWDEAHF